MRKLASAEWRPVLLGVAGTLIFLALSLGPASQAAHRASQTIPTPTPRTAPAPGSDRILEQPSEDAGGVLTVYQEITPQDVMAGEETIIRVQITNTSSDLLSDVLFSDPLDPALHPLEVRATQGAARVEGQSVIVDMGTLEAGQTAVVIIWGRVISEAQAGQIILNQATIYFDGGQIISDVSAAGLPPNELPATGQDRTRPSGEDGSH